MKVLKVLLYRKTWQLFMIVVYLLQQYPSTYKFINPFKPVHSIVDIVFIYKKTNNQKGGGVIILMYLNVVTCDGLGFTVKIKQIAYGIYLYINIRNSFQNEL